MTAINKRCQNGLPPAKYQTVQSQMAAKAVEIKSNPAWPTADSVKNESSL
ncbi:conserved hypothetical protein [Ahrensia sp. R2A130]|nr:conserved hypothetical protein [Ahrensia sp. R2A130]